MALTDTHCHLNHADFQSDCAEAIQRARDAGVARLLVIGCDLASSRAAVNLALANDGVQAAIGMHPESVLNWNPEVRAELEALRHDAGSRVVAWGEVGLDYYWDSSPHEIQLGVFEEQIAIAKGFGLPLIIHCRNAFTDVLDVLERHGNPPGVLHCFTGTPEEAVRAVAAGFYIGVGGIATFKKSEALREIVRSVPINRILLETDAPYLAPQQRRGKRNEPAFVAYVAETIAPLLALSPQKLADQTSDNASQLFGPATD